MKLKLAINGFGRIGRNVLRSIFESGRKDIEVIAINDPAPVETNAHLLKYDSVHGSVSTDVTVSNNMINVAGVAISCTSILDPSKIVWKDVDIVLECTGKFTDKNQASMHLQGGSKRVLISAPSKDADKTIVYGVNHSSIGPEDIIVSNASCTTNCLAPIAKVLHENCGIKKGFMTTIHSYTGDQPVLDLNHKDLYRARAATLSMVPTTTGAAKAVGLVLPELKGKLDGVSLRVPTPNVSCVDFTFQTMRNTNPNKINEAIRNAAASKLKGILDITEEKLVSIDFNHNIHSSIFAIDQTRVVGKKLVRILSWYDNEWAFSNRMVDTAVAMSKYL